MLRIVRGSQGHADRVEGPPRKTITEERNQPHQSGADREENQTLTVERLGRAHLNQRGREDSLGVAAEEWKPREIISPVGIPQMQPLSLLASSKNNSDPMQDKGSVYKNVES